MTQKGNLNHIYKFSEELPRIKGDTFVKKSIRYQKRVLLVLILTPLKFL